MPAINTIAIREAFAPIAKRNFAQEEPGVITVFVIVGLVAIGLIILFFYKKALARKNAKAQF